MPKAMRVHEPGGPEALQFEEVEIGAPGPGEALIEHTAIGVNFIDTYYRRQIYPWPESPLIPGAEGVGRVLAVGPDVTLVEPGQRVAYTTGLGAYAEQRLIPAERLVVVPDSVSDEVAAASILKGMTVQYLLRRTFPVQSGQTVLFHAAAGGVGLIAGQWGAHLGATMIGTAGSDEKCELAKANGYAHVINYNTEDFVERVKDITNGQGVDVVYDSVGKDTYPASLDCLKRLGMWVVFGQSSGLIEDFDLGILARKGSLFTTRPTLFAYIATREELEATAADLFDVLGNGAVNVAVNQKFALSEAATAHTLLENRQTTGSTVLIP